MGGRKGGGGGKEGRDNWRSEIKWDDRSCMAKKEDYVIAHGRRGVACRSPFRSFLPYIRLAAR